MATEFLNPVTTGVLLLSLLLLAGATALGGWFFLTTCVRSSKAASSTVAPALPSQAVSPSHVGGAPAAAEVADAPKPAQSNSDEAPGVAQPSEGPRAGRTHTSESDDAMVDAPDDVPPPPAVDEDDVYDPVATLTREQGVVRYVGDSFGFIVRSTGGLGAPGSASKPRESVGDDMGDGSDKPAHPLPGSSNAIYFSMDDVDSGIVLRRGELVSYFILPAQMTGVVLGNRVIRPHKSKPKAIGVTQLMHHATHASQRDTGNEDTAPAAAPPSTGAHPALLVPTKSGSSLTTLVTSPRVSSARTFAEHKHVPIVTSDRRPSLPLDLQSQPTGAPDRDGPLSARSHSHTDNGSVTSAGSNSVFRRRKVSSASADSGNGSFSSLAVPRGGNSRNAGRGHDNTPSGILSWRRGMDAPSLDDHPPASAVTPLPAEPATGHASLTRTDARPEAIPESTSMASVSDSETEGQHSPPPTAPNSMEELADVHSAPAPPTAAAAPAVQPSSTDEVTGADAEEESIILAAVPGVDIASEDAFILPPLASPDILDLGSMLPTSVAMPSLHGMHSSPALSVQSGSAPASSRVVMDDALLGASFAPLVLDPITDDAVMARGHHTPGAPLPTHTIVHEALDAAAASSQMLHAPLPSYSHMMAATSMPVSAGYAPGGGYMTTSSSHAAQHQQQHAYYASRQYTQQQQQQAMYAARGGYPSPPPGGAAGYGPGVYAPAMSQYAPGYSTGGGHGMHAAPRRVEYAAPPPPLPRGRAAYAPMHQQPQHARGVHYAGLPPAVSVPATYARQTSYDAFVGSPSAAHLMGSDLRRML